MKRERLTKIILSVLCVLALAACGTRADSPAPGTPAPDSPPGNSSMDALDEGTAGTPKSFDTETEVQGSVVEFFDDFCVITPLETGDDDSLAYQAAPGYEDPEKTITIHYQEGCIIQIAEINAVSGEKNLVDASIADIERGAFLIISGTWAGERDLNAATIYITRYNGS